MPTPQRRQPTGVIARLLAEPHRFGFFQAVRLLDRWLRRSEGSGVGTKAVSNAGAGGGANSGVGAGAGAGASASAGATRGVSRKIFFRNNLSLSFPASELAEFKLTRVIEPLADGTLPLKAPALAPSVTPASRSAIAPLLTPSLDAVASKTASQASLRTASAMPVAIEADDVDRIEITPAFMSLLGTGGALPIFYTEMLAEREGYHRDTAARAFLDIFQHRAVSLFYGAWRKHRLPVQYEDDERHRFLPLILAVAGIGQTSLRERLHGDEGGVSDDTLAYFAGLLQQRPISAGVIRQVVSEYFAVPAQLEQFIGRWFTLPPDSNSQLGFANATLGADAVMGERVWQRDLRMRLTVGPMPRAKLKRFLPGGPAALALRELLTLMTGVSLEYEVRLALHADDVQGTRLDEGTTGAQLGWDSFLVTEPSHHDRSDAGYDIHALQ